MGKEERCKKYSKWVDICKGWGEQQLPISVTHSVKLQFLVVSSIHVMAIMQPGSDHNNWETYSAP